MSNELQLSSREEMKALMIISNSDLNTARLRHGGLRKEMQI